MCGKFTQMMSWSELVRYADILAADAGPADTVTPMRFASVICVEDGKRGVKRMCWGLVPPWEKDPSRGNRFIHARAETIDTKRTFRNAFAERRGLVAVSTFNEGEEITPTKTRQYVITPKDEKPRAIAVIWERWQGRDGSPSLLSFAVVTVPPNQLISTITERMPALIAPKDWAKWLGEEPASAEEIMALLRPDESPMDMRPADGNREPSAKINRERDPDLFE